jgi:hypothetical protein
MNNIIEDNDEDQFANGQSSRDLRANSGATEPQTQLEAVNVIELCPDAAREEYSASENWERERQRCGSQFLPEQIDADEQLPGYLREPICPASNHGAHVISQGSTFIKGIRSQFSLRRRVMPISAEERLRVTRQTRTPFHRAWMQFVENRL